LAKSSSIAADGLGHLLDLDREDGVLAGQRLLRIGVGELGIDRALLAGLGADDALAKPGMNCDWPMTIWASSPLPPSNSLPSMRPTKSTVTRSPSPAAARPPPRS
jgi:hypothetical protein